MADTKTKLHELAGALSSVKSRSIETRDALQELSELLVALAERTPALEENKLKGYKNQLAETKEILEGVQASLKLLAKEGDVFTQLGRMVREYISDIEVANQKQAELFKPLAPEGKKPFTTLGPEYDLTKIVSTIRDINEELDKSNEKALRFKQTLGMVNRMSQEASEYATGLGPQTPPSIAGAYTPATAEERAGRPLEELEKLDLATQAWEEHTRALGIDDAVLEKLYVTYKKVLAEAQKFAEARREWTRQPTVEEYKGRLHKEALRPDPTKRDFMRVDKTLFKDLAGMAEDILDIGLGASDVEERFKAAAIHSGVLALNTKTVKDAIQEIPKQIDETKVLAVVKAPEVEAAQTEKAIATKEKLTQATETQTKAIEGQISAEEVEIRVAALVARAMENVAAAKEERAQKAVQKSAEIAAATEQEVVAEEKLTRATEAQIKAQAMVTAESPGIFIQSVKPEELEIAIENYRRVEQALKDVGIAMTDLKQIARGEKILLEARVDPGWSYDDDKTPTPTIDRRHEEVARAIDSETAAIEKQIIPTKELTQTKEQLAETLKRLYHELAKQVHPDLAPPGSDVGLRTEAMTRVNAAYARGDLEALEDISQKLSQEGIESFRGLGDAIKDVATQREAGTQATTESADIERAQQAILEISIDRHKQKAQALKEETVAQKDANQALAIGPPSGPGGGGITGGGGDIRKVPPTKIPTQIIGTRDDIAEAYKKEGVYLAVVDKALTLFIEKNKFAEAAGNKFRVELDMINQSVRVSALVFKDWNEQTGKRQYKTKAELETMAVSFTGQEIDKREELQAQFKVWTNDSVIAERAINNLSAAAARMDATIDDVGPGVTNFNDNLARFSVTTRNAFGQLQRGTVTMDRFGNVAQTVKSKYETFADAIGNSINKVIRWGIAVGVVYGTMRKLRQGTSDMIEMQASMADIAIVTGKAMDEVGESLNAVAMAADATGITLVEALSVFEKALRATGDYANESDRATAATELLGHALVFARLGNIDVTKAIDTLVGALRQSGMEISQAEGLLDKWVATTKTAYVSLEDLGEGFAITAAQAQSVGVSIDQLNGIIATVAKTTTLSSTEIGNFTRTMLAALESDQAVDVLRHHGIAIKDLEGDYRDWGDVIQDVSDLFRAGAISEKELSKIGIALGGGRRRGPQFIAFIKEYSEVGRIAEISSNAQGDAAAALDIKMETLMNTLNGLQVAISKMVAAAGTEGGLLDVMTNLVTIATEVVNVLSGVTKAFGTSTTKLLAFVAAYATLKKLGVSAKLSGMLGGGAAEATGKKALSAGLVGGFASVGTKEAGKSFAEGAKGHLQRAMPHVGRALGMGALEMMMSGSLMRATGSAVGAGIGSAAGAALGSAGGPIGTIIGASLGAALMGEVESTIKQAETKAAYYRKLERGDEVSYEETFKRLDDAVEKMRSELDVIKKRGPTLEGETPIPVWEARTQEELLETVDLFIASLRTQAEKVEILGEFAGGYGFEDVEIEASREEIKELEDLKVAIEKLTPAVEDNTKAREADVSEWAKEVAKTGRRIEPGIKVALEAESLEELLRFSRGETPRAAVTRQAAVSEDLPKMLTTMVQTMGPQLEEAFGVGQTAIEELAVTMSHLDPTAIEMIQTRLERLTETQRELASLNEIINATTSELAHRGDVERSFQDDISETTTLIAGLMDEFERSKQIQVPTGFMRLPEELSPEQIDEAIALAGEMQNEFAKAVGVAPELLREQAATIVTLYDEEFGEILGLTQNFLDYMLEQYVEAQEKLEEDFSVRRLKDVSPEKFGEIQARNRYWVEFLARIKGMTTPEYLEEEGYQENLVMGPNNVWQKILTTSEAMSFTLQDILETEKKQLEGMWNIPSGATFWVPLTSLFYQQQEGGGGVPELPPLEDVEPKEDVPPPIPSGEEMAKERMKEKQAEIEADYTRMKARRPRYGDEVDIAAQREQTKERSDLIGRMRSIAKSLDMMPEEYAQYLLEQFKIIDEPAATGDIMAQVAQMGDEIGKAASMTLLELGDVAGPTGEGPEAAAEMIRQAATELQEAVTYLNPLEYFETFGAGAQDLLNKATTAFDGVAELVSAPPEFKIIVDVVSEKLIQIMNTITLDGTVIKRYMSEVNARETGRAAKASGYTETLE